MGTDSGPRVMLAGHMDEVGFMVKHVTQEGFLRFLPLGGWFDQVLLGQRVLIKTRNHGDVLGVIGAKPPHLLPAEERALVVKREKMYIDIGATSKAEADASGVLPGDAVIPHASFETLASGKAYMSKAFDDRVGTALVISALQELKTREHPNTVYGAVTVMEEVGLRGAKTSAWEADPDVAIVLESDIAGDVPGIKPEQSNIKMGAGPSLLIYDRSMIPNQPFRNFTMDTAEAIGVPLQLASVEAGGTDAGAIHQHKTGVPSIVLGVPARHIHSDSSIIHRADFDHSVKLLVELLVRLDSATVASFTS
jgi:endoglucanase